MYGAILGDIIGEPYEAVPDKDGLSGDKPLFSVTPHVTDNTCMTIAIGDALLSLSDGIVSKAYELWHDYRGKGNYENPYEKHILTVIAESLKKWENLYPELGCTNDSSAICSSSAGWLYGNIELTEYMAWLTAAVTHNHPKGIKEAQAVAGTIFHARKGKREYVRDYLRNRFNYRLDKDYKTIKSDPVMSDTFQETVSAAVTSYLYAEDFEKTIRNAVNLGRDTNTCAVIAGSIAEADYHIPKVMVRIADDVLDDRMRNIVHRFYYDNRIDR